MNLVLLGENENLVVESLNNQFEFVHNKEDGSNWFNQKTLAKMFGVTVQSISQSLKTISKHFPKESRNPLIIKLKVNSNNRNNAMFFYDFKVVTMLASRINTVEAFDMLEWIDSSLNTMFNVITGRDSMNSNKDWLKNQCEVKQVQAMKYKSASKLLYEADGKHDAKKVWSKYKKLEAEALKFKEMYLDYERLDREVATVRNDRTEQLKLI